MAVVIALSLAEVIVRALGHGPFADPLPGNKIAATPSPMFCPDSVYGYGNCPGARTITLNGTLTYTLSIDSADGSRSVPLGVAREAAPEIHIHGCSFFAGMGVDDDEVLSARLQQLVGDSCRVVNRSIPGHGMTTQLSQLQHTISQGRVPAVAVFSIASFHLPRNPGAPEYLNRFRVIKDRPMRFLCSELEEDGHLRFFVKDVEPQLLPGARFSGLIHLMGNVRNRLTSQQTDQLPLQLALMDSAHALALHHGVVPLFVLITTDSISERLAEHATTKGYALLRSEVDYNSTDFNLMPDDGHPNARAHAAYADEIHARLRLMHIPLLPDTR